VVFEPGQQGLLFSVYMMTKQKGILLRTDCF